MIHFKSSPSSEINCCQIWVQIIHLSLRCHTELRLLWPKKRRIILYSGVFWLCIQVRLPRFHQTRVSTDPCWKRSFQVTVFPRWSHQHSPEIQVGFMVTTLRQLVTSCDLVFPWGRGGNGSFLFKLSSGFTQFWQFSFWLNVFVLEVCGGVVSTCILCDVYLPCLYNEVCMYMASRGCVCFFSTLTRNIRHRRGEKVVINVPSKSNSSVFTVIILTASVRHETGRSGFNTWPGHIRDYKNGTPWHSASRG